MSALYGIIHARILEGNLEEAEEQLEFLSEIQVPLPGCVLPGVGILFLAALRSLSTLPHCAA